MLMPVVGLHMGVGRRSRRSRSPVNPPVNTVLPVISGNAQIGVSLGASTGSWSGQAPISFAFQWCRGGIAIPGATGASYLLASADAGALITCVITATNAGGSASATSAALGPVALPRAPSGALITFWGDGVNSEGAAPGMRNWPTWALASFNGRVMPSEGWMQCKSGETLDGVFARRDAAVKQAPEIFVYASDGHNDGLYSSGYATQLTKWVRNAQFAIDNLPSTTRIVMTIPLTSAVAGESTGGDWRMIVSNLIREQVATWQAIHGARIILFDTLAAIGGFGPWDHTTMSNDADRTHPNALGGWTLGKMFFALMDGQVAAATVEDILAATTATTRRGANLHPDRLLSGTTGTRSGAIAPTGSYATGQRITNNLANGTGIAVACSKSAQTGYEQQLAAVSGTPAATQTIVQDDTANITLTGIGPGDYCAFMVRARMDDGTTGFPAGLNNFGFALGSIGNLSTTSDLAAAGLPSSIGAVDQVWVCAPKASFANNTAVANPVFTTRYSAVAINTRITFERPQLFKLYLNARTAPWYFGNDTILGTNYRIRLTGTGVSGEGFASNGTITAATVGTVRVEPGSWSGGGLTFTRVMRRNGAVVSGAFSTGWTYAMAGQVLAGDVIAIDVIATNSLGSATRTITFNVV